MTNKKDKRIFKKPKYKKGRNCLCGGRLFWSQIPCPDLEWQKIYPYSHCLLIHYGYVCKNCGKIYQYQ